MGWKHLIRTALVLAGNERIEGKMKSLILVGDARKRLTELKDGSVRTCVTSPPYFGLRDYGTADWKGGSADCNHAGKPMATKANINKNISGGRDVKNAEALEFFKKTCGKCGAERVDLQMGLEETPEDYVQAMVELFREVRRVLTDDGTLWLNLGDSYNKDKQLIGIPWRVAFALQADGWILRQDIIWAKPAPMPESVTDRCTKSHEYVFLLSKSRKYFFDHEAIKDPAIHATEDGKRNKRDVWTIPTKGFKGAHFAVMPEALVEPCILAGSEESDTVLDPFTGSGTVAVVANRLGRHFVGTELNAEYAEIAYNRITGDAPLMNEVLLTHDRQIDLN